MSGTNANKRITYTKAYLSIGFRRLLFPIDVRLFLNTLPEEGYILEEDVFKIKRRFGAQIAISADIARKGDFVLSLNSERGFIGIDGPEPLSVVEEITNVKRILEDRLQIDLPNTASFYEFLADGSVKSNKTPVETFSEVTKALTSISHISKSLGEDLSLYGVRLASAGQEPNQADFLDIRIEPNIVHAKNLYFFSVVYRKQNLESVAQFAKKFSDTLTDIISHLERTK